MAFETSSPWYGDACEDLVRVAVVALAHPQRRTLFGVEVEARIDLILAVGEVEPHATPSPPARPALIEQLRVRSSNLASVRATLRSAPAAASAFRIRRADLALEADEAARKLARLGLARRHTIDEASIPGSARAAASPQKTRVGPPKPLIFEQPRRSAGSRLRAEPERARTAPRARRRIGRRQSEALGVRVEIASSGGSRRWRRRRSSSSIAADKP